MDGIQCSTVGILDSLPSIYGATSNASITINVIEHCKNMYADDPTSLFDSTQKLLLFCKRHRLVNWLSTDHVSRPVISTCSRVEQGDYGMAVYLLLALKNPFPLMSVSSSVDDQGRKLFYGNSQVDGPGECSILDRTAIPHSHHSTRLFWSQSSLKKASHEKDPTGIHCHALSPTTCIIALCSGRSMS